MPAIMVCGLLGPVLLGQFVTPVRVVPPPNPPIRVTVPGNDFTSPRLDSSLNTTRLTAPNLHSNLTVSGLPSETVQGLGNAAPNRESEPSYSTVIVPPPEQKPEDPLPEDGGDDDDDDNGPRSGVQISGMQFFLGLAGLLVLIHFLRRNP